MADDESLKMMAGLLARTLDKDIVENGVTLARAGQTIIILPETHAKAVFVSGNQTLHDLWDTLSKTNHTHSAYETNLANYQAELIRTTDRVTALEQDRQQAAE